VIGSRCGCEDTAKTANVVDKIDSNKRRVSVVHDLPLQGSKEAAGAAGCVMK